MEGRGALPFECMVLVSEFSERLLFDFGLGFIYGSEKDVIVAEKVWEILGEGRESSRKKSDANKHFAQLQL